MHLLPNDILDTVFQCTATASTCEVVCDNVKGLGLKPLGCEQWTSADGSRVRAG